DDNHHTLDRGQAVPRSIVRKVGVGLGDDTGPLAAEEASLYVQAAVRCMHAEERWWRQHALTLESKSVFDSGDAFSQGEHARDVRTREQQCPWRLHGGPRWGHTYWLRSSMLMKLW